MLARMFKNLPILRVLLLFALIAGSVEVQAKPPVLKDRKKATRLRPTAGSFDRVDAVRARATLPRTTKKGWIPNLSFYSRFVSIPGGVMKLFFADYQPLASASAGVALELGDPRLRTITIEFDWTGLMFQPGNWRAKAKAPSEAEYTELNLHMISVDATYRDVIQLEGKLDFFYGAGLGIAALVGKATTTDVLPTCQVPVSQCQHWRKVTQGPFLPTRVIPVVHVTLGLQLEVAKDIFTRLQIGFRNVFYAGLSTGFAL